MQIDDEILVRKSVAGDNDAFGLLVERYQGVVFQIALRQINNHSDAEDIAQEAFVQAYRKLNTLRNPRAFASWLYAITYNQCRYFKRREKRQIDTFPLEEAKAAIIPNSQRKFHLQEQKRRLWDVIYALPRQYQQVLTLFYKDGLSTKEIGEQLGMSQNHVLVQLHRARHKLKEEFVMSRQSNAVGVMPGSFTEQVIKAISRQSIPSIRYVCG